MSGVTVYNRMVMPGIYEGMLEEYRALVEDVTLWDVAVQRQVEIRGRDAFALTQYLCTATSPGWPQGSAATRSSATTRAGSSTIRCC